jgi:hypothetical protein
MLASSTTRSRRSRRRLDPEHFDFDVRRLKEEMGADGLYPIRYAVLVTNRASGKGATFAGGHGEAWVERLDEKLQAGELG